MLKHVSRGKVPIDGLRNWKTKFQKQTATGKKWRLLFMAA
jgi:hypothetical protein